MERLFKFKDTDNTYSRVRSRWKQHLSYSNEVVNVRKTYTFEELEAHEDYEELV